MLLKTLRKIPKTIGFRLTFWYSCIFVVSVFLLFLFAYIYLQTTLIHKDHDETLSRLGELQALYQSGGIPLIERDVISYKKSPEKNKFFIRISNRNNQTEYFYLPYQWVEFDIKSLEVTPPTPKKWFRLPDQGHKAFLEINSIRLNDGDFLQVGQDTRERLRILIKFKGAATIIILPLLLLGILGGNLLAYRALHPIRHLIDSVQSISRDMEALGRRVPNPHSGDELEKLIFLFNEMLQKIETLIKAMKNSLDNVAHDLRTPVTRLRCMAELALQAERLPKECQNALGECLEESIEIQKLLDTIMDISEAETGVLHLNLQIVPIDQVLKKVTDLYAFVAEEKGISLEVAAQPHLFTLADPTRLSQALANLIDNAIKFTFQGGHISLKAFPQGGKAAISIKDTGVGISEKDLPKIWERLYRGDQSRSKKGLGLGLSLVKAIIVLHKGSIEVESQAGKGSTFTVLLPLAQGMTR